MAAAMPARDVVFDNLLKEMALGCDAEDRPQICKKGGPQMGTAGLAVPRGLKTYCSII